MRISDLMMNNSFINNISRTKKRLAEINEDIISGIKISKPSDSPVAAARILRLGNNISANTNYANNIENSLAYLNETTFALESIQGEVSDIMVKLTELDNAANESNYKIYADQIDLSLKSILEVANSQSDGKYIFGGTDHSTSPFGYNAGDTAIEVKSSDISGSQVVKLSSSTLQKINLSGTEVFGTILNAAGTLDGASVVGSTYSISGTAYNADKEEFSVSATFTKTATNTYSLTYDVLDSTSTSVFASAPAAVEVKFDPDTGKVISAGGKTSGNIKISAPGSKLDFNLSLKGVSEGTANSISTSLNQKSDIFNTLIRIKNDLYNGIKPSEEDMQLVKDFNAHILNKTSEAGNITNQLYSTQELLLNQKTVLDTLYSKEQEVDTAEAVIELQNQDYLLSLAYKVSSTILPKSLLDYI